MPRNINKRNENRSRHARQTVSQLNYWILKRYDMWLRLVRDHFFVTSSFSSKVKQSYLCPVAANTSSSVVFDSSWSPERCIADTLFSSVSAFRPPLPSSRRYTNTTTFNYHGRGLKEKKSIFFRLLWSGIKVFKSSSWKGEEERRRGGGGRGAKRESCCSLFVCLFFLWSS